MSGHAKWLKVAQRFLKEGDNLIVEHKERRYTKMGDSWVLVKKVNNQTTVTELSHGVCSMLNEIADSNTFVEVPLYG